jgi:hypothetical protein
MKAVTPRIPCARIPSRGVAIARILLAGAAIALMLPAGAALAGTSVPTTPSTKSAVPTAPSTQAPVPSKPATPSPLPKKPVQPVSNMKSTAGPYRAEEVKVRTRDGHTLAGTLTLPKSAGRYPAVLLLSSADPQNRDASNVHDYYHPFRQIADTLTRAGLAVLRLDDRGVGGSTGRLDSLDTRARAQDARDALAFLRARKDIRADRLALLGHSEGALIAGMIAGEDSTIHAAVLMASTGRTGRATVEWMNHRMLAHTRAEGRERNAMFHEAMAAWDERVKVDPWAMFFDTYDPTVVMHKVRAPLLILHGEQDSNCPPTDADNLGDAAKSSGNLDVTVHTLPGLDHAFLNVSEFKDGVASNDSAYLLSPALLGEISGWLAKHLQ